MKDTIRFELNGQDVLARDGESIWQAANRQGVVIPHLCWSDAPGYRADGNCRACMVEIEGERVLAASCMRQPTDGMVVRTDSDRAENSRRIVFELLAADQPTGEAAPDPASRFWQWAEAMDIGTSRFGQTGHAIAADDSHHAMSVNLDACIHCNLCVRACREVQVNDVIGMAGAGDHMHVSFDFDDAMGRFGFDYIHHDGRLTVPLIRREGIAKDDIAGLDPMNPLTHFREATWQEALDRAAGALVDIRENHGPSALAGFGSAKGSNEEAYLFQKLVRTGFGTNNVDHCTRLCHASSVAALMETVGSGAVSAPFTEAENADVVIVIGSNPAVNHPVAATYFKQAAKRGTKLIIIDPRGQALARHATHMLKQKPGSDVSLLNALMHVIVEEGLYDQAYIDRHTVGFQQMKDHLKSFTPEAMAPICGIDADTLRDVARMFAGAKAAMVFWGMGISQHIHGTDNARCLISLVLMTGQVGRPGTGLHPLRGQNNVQGASDAGLIPMVFPDYQPVGDSSVRARFEDLWGHDLDPEPGLTVVEITDAMYNRDIRGLYVMGENPAMSDPNVSHARAALSRLDMLVVQDLFITETAAFADVILPASAWPEKAGTVTNTNRQVQMGRPAVSPPGDARQDIWIIQQMAARLGLNWQYDDVQDVFDEMRQAMPSIAGITWDRLMAESAVTYPCENEGDPGQPVIFDDGFPIDGGRGKFVPADIIPPDETPDADFPFVLTTGRILEHWHTGSMTRRATALDALEPEAIVLMSPDDLHNLGASPGDRIRVESRRGVIEITGRADGTVPRGMIFIPFCFAEAAANLLTNQALDPFGKIPEVKYCAARLTRA